MKITAHVVTKTNPFLDHSEEYYQFNEGQVPICFISTALFQQSEMEIIAGLEKIANYISDRNYLANPLGVAVIEVFGNSEEKPLP